MKRTGWLSLFLVVLAAPSLMFLSSCASLYTPMYDVPTMNVEKKINGYLLELSVRKPIEDVSAIVTRDNWLLITLVGATVDFERFRSWKPDDLIAEVQVVGTKTSVQLTVKLKEKFRTCEVTHDKASDNVEISLFSQ